MSALVSISPRQLLAGAGQLVRRGDRLVQGGDRASGDRRGAALAARVAEGDHAVTGLDAGGVAEAGDGEAGCVLQLNHRDVLGVVVSHDRGRVGAAVADVGDLDRSGAIDHVVVRQDLTVRGQHDAGAGRGGLLIAVGRHHVDQPGVHPGRDLAGGQRRRGGGGGPGHCRRIHAADQAARGGPRGERQGGGDDQPALVVPARRRRRLGGEAVSSAITRSTRIAGSAGEGSGSLAGWIALAARALF